MHWAFNDFWKTVQSQSHTWSDLPSLARLRSAALTDRLAQKAQNFVDEGGHVDGFGDVADTAGF